MKKCAIMQPTYLPWAGYFNLMNQVDCFVFLDDVQFERRSWQNRNRILLNGREHLLTVPVVKVDRSTPINQIKICNETNWRFDHWKTLMTAYKKAPYGTEMLELLEKYYNTDSLDLQFLSEFNQSIIRALATSLGIGCQFLRASYLGCKGKRTTHLIAICEAVGASIYVTSCGAVNYLKEDGFSAQTPIELWFQDYLPKPYPQRKVVEFVSHLSIVDVIAHIGIEMTKSYVC